MEEKPGSVMTIEELSDLPEDTAVNAVQAGAGRQSPLSEGWASLALPERGY